MLLPNETLVVSLSTRDFFFFKSWIFIFTSPLSILIHIISIFPPATLDQSVLSVAWERQLPNYKNIENR